MRTRGGLPAADIQYHMGAAYYEDHGAETYDGHCMVIAPVLVSPKARGQVWLRSADPTAKPHIITNSLSEPDDVSSMVAGMRLAREIAAQGPLREIVVSELKPGAAAEEREQLEADLRRRLMLIYHPVGTARMSDTHPRSGRRLAAARTRSRGVAGDRRIDHAGDPRRQHERAHDHGRRAWRRLDPRPRRARGRARAAAGVGDGPRGAHRRVSRLAEMSATVEAGVGHAAVSAINHHREGEGPPLVLLHGIGHHWQAWRPVIEELSADHDVIACDSPGFGASPALPAGVEPTIYAYVDAFERFFEELGLERPHVAGNSMGGAIALELARRGAVATACAFSPAGFWTPAELRFCQLSLHALASMPALLRGAIVALARTRAGRVALFSQTFGWPARLPAEEAVSTLLDAWASPAFGATLEAFGSYRFDAPEELRGAELTIAWGKRDRLLPYRRQAPRARALLPWAEHLTLGAGHVPFFDDPAAVAAVISRRAHDHAER